MTDNEIRKALECCAQPIPICKECPCYDSNVPYPCADQLKWATLNLIDSQQAEIERLNRENNKNFDKWNILEERTKKRYAELYQEAKSVVRSEAVREFAERLKELYTDDSITDDYHCTVGVIKKNIDEIVKEMEGDAE